MQENESDQMTLGEYRKLTAPPKSNEQLKEIT